MSHSDTDWSSNLHHLSFFSNPVVVRSLIKL
jgi:hypothetical protein